MSKKFHACLGAMKLTGACRDVLWAKTSIESWSRGPDFDFTSEGYCCYQSANGMVEKWKSGYKTITMQFSRSRVSNRMLKMILWVFIIYAGYCLLLFLAQRQMLFPRYMVTPLEGADKSVPSLEKIWLSMDFGQVEAWYLPPAPEKRKAPSPLVIFAHGNAELIDFCPPEMLPFTKWGIGVLLVEFPGYGRSGGTPSQKSITATLVTAYDTMIRRADIDADRIVFYGRSIGGGAVCSLLGERPAAAVILMSTFTSVRSFAWRYLAPAFLVRDPFDNLSVIKDYNGPLLIFHGKRDEVIPFAHGRSLHQSNPKSRFISYDCGHNDCPPDWIQFWREIGRFLSQVGLKDMVSHKSH